MGSHPNIRHDYFPRQSAGKVTGRRVKVIFHPTAAPPSRPGPGYHHNLPFDHVFDGTIVREDREPPYLTIIRLDNGQHVLDTECVWFTEHMYMDHRAPEREKSLTMSDLISLANMGNGIAALYLAAIYQLGHHGFPHRTYDSLHEWLLSIRDNATKAWSTPLEIAGDAPTLGGDR